MMSNNAFNVKLKTNPNYFKINGFKLFSIKKIIIIIQHSTLFLNFNVYSIFVYEQHKNVIVLYVITITYNL